MASPRSRTRGAPHHGSPHARSPIFRPRAQQPPVLPAAIADPDQTLYHINDASERGRSPKHVDASIQT